MISLPAHVPCGLDGAGDVEGTTMIATCTAVRSNTEFARRSCKRNPKQPTRGADTCERCRGAGFVVVGTRPGCGATFALCPRCGLRARINEEPCAACSPARAA